MDKAEKKCPINREFSCDNNCAWYVMTDAFSEKGQVGAAGNRSVFGGNMI